MPGKSPSRRLSQAELLLRLKRNAEKRVNPSSQGLRRRVFLGIQKTSALTVKNFYTPMLSKNLSSISTEQLAGLADKIRKDRNLVENDRKAMLALLSKNSGREV